eukprot:2988044-Amphidinium_carterae.1
MESKPKIVPPPPPPKIPRTQREKKATSSPKHQQKMHSLKVLSQFWLCGFGALGRGWGADGTCCWSKSYAGWS